MDADGGGDIPGDRIQQSRSIKELLHTQQWLDSQLHQHLVKLFADKIDLSQETDISKLTDSIATLERELIAETSKLNIKELILKRLQLGEEMELQLFEAFDKIQISPMAEKHKPAIEQLTGRQRELVMEIMEKHELYTTKKDRLDELRGENYELMKQNRELFHRLREQRERRKQKAKNFSKDEDAQRLRKRLETVVSKIEIQRYTLQGLIFGSGINWAQDPRMEALMMSLGEPMEV